MDIEFGAGYANILSQINLFKPVVVTNAVKIFITK